MKTFLFKTIVYKMWWVKIIEFCVFSGKPKTTYDYEMWEFIAFDLLWLFAYI